MHEYIDERNHCRIQDPENEIEHENGGADLGLCHTQLTEVAEDLDETASHSEEVAESCKVD